MSLEPAESKRASIYESFRQGDLLDTLEYFEEGDPGLGEFLADFIALERKQYITQADFEAGNEVKRQVASVILDELEELSREYLQIVEAFDNEPAPKFQEEYEELELYREILDL